MTAYLEILAHHLVQALQAILVVQSVLGHLGNLEFLGLLADLVCLALENQGLL